MMKKKGGAAALGGPSSGGPNYGNVINSPAK
jgi:hypothetical protein